MMDVIAHRQEHPNGRPNPQSILTLWREGYNTYEIAKMLSVGTSEISEAYVANKLTYLRQNSRPRHG